MPDGSDAWLGVGVETTDQRGAIIYTMVKCAKCHGHNPEAYLADVLKRLPGYDQPRRPQRVAAVPLETSH